MLIVPPGKLKTAVRPTEYAGFWSLSGGLPVLYFQSANPSTGTVGGSPISSVPL